MRSFTTNFKTKDDHPMIPMILYDGMFAIAEFVRNKVTKTKYGMVNRTLEKIIDRELRKK